MKDDYAEVAFVVVLSAIVLWALFALEGAM